MVPAALIDRHCRRHAELAQTSVVAVTAGADHVDEEQKVFHESFLVQRPQGEVAEVQWQPLPAHAGMCTPPGRAAPDGSPTRDGA